MNNAYLSLGSNEEDRKQWLERALTILAERCGTIEQQSPIYETAAWGITDQAPFLNMAVHLQTSLEPHELLQQILTIEIELGRQREVKWGPRTLDIDILLFNDDVIDTPELKVPHPFLQERRFTLVPLAAIAADIMHPVYHKTTRQLLDECADPLEVTVYEWD
jgi:2-amino-4-hydroxy-6-hydroxymethyldihydropteridine diphosphokinase